MIFWRTNDSDNWCTCPDPRRMVYRTVLRSTQLRLSMTIAVLTTMLPARTMVRNTVTKWSRECGAPGGIRTPDHRLRRAVLYPAELRARIGKAIDRIPRCLAVPTGGGASITQSFGMDFVATAILIFTWERSDHFPLMVPFDKLRTGSAHHERKMIRPSQASFACAALPQVELPSAG